MECVAVRLFLSKDAMTPRFFYGLWFVLVLVLFGWTGGAGWARTSEPAWQSAWVSWVMDGDTVLVVLDGQHEPVKLRIDGIDAPESCQPGGEAARNVMLDLVMRKAVQVRVDGHDTYGRAVGRLSVNGLDVGAEMVRLGMAWAYRFHTGRGPYAALQRQAQAQRAGLFGDKSHAMSPPVFRKFHGTCHGA